MEGREGGRWNFVICFGERQAEEVVEVVTCQVVLSVQCVCVCVCVRERERERERERSREREKIWE